MISQRLHLFALPLLASCAATQAQEPVTAAAKAIDNAATQTAIYSNEEEVYFDSESGKESAPALFVRLDANGGMTFTDAFGDLAKQPSAVKLVEKNDAEMTLQIGERQTVLRRANPITCWVALKKATPKPDGSEDWTFTRNIKSHDQGGRILVGGGDSDTPATVVRMRSVKWPAPSTNRPTRVLYIHKPEDPVKAISYSWANLDAARVGINLRWVQASCTVDGRERAAKQTSDSFKP